MAILFKTNGIHFDSKGRGCSPFYLDLVHHPFSRKRGIKLFLHQIISGVKLLFSEVRNDK